MIGSNTDRAFASSGIISRTARCVNTRRSLTRLLDCTERGLAVKATRTCSVTDCPSPITHLDYCKAHYLRWRRHGDPLAGGPRRIRPTVEGFWAQVNRNGPVPSYRPELGPCWIWDGRMARGGYGSARLPGFRQQMGAHVAAWFLTYGALPAHGLQLDHLCRVRRCCRPTHLEPVTARENTLRSLGFAARNASKTHCDSGHEFTPANTHINRDGSRACRACRRDAQRRYLDRKRAA